MTIAGEEFLRKYNPDRLHLFTRDVERCYMGAAPALAEVKNMYGVSVAENWVKIMLERICNFSGAGVKMLPLQLHMTQSVIINRWGFMKVTELMHFFELLVSGEYGHFYGAIDPMIITESLHKFAVDRENRIHRYELAREKAAKEAEDERDAPRKAWFRTYLRDWLMDLPEYIRLSQLPDGTFLSLEEMMDLTWLLRM